MVLGVALSLFRAFAALPVSMTQPLPCSSHGTSKNVCTSPFGNEPATVISPPSAMKVASNKVTSSSGGTNTLRSVIWPRSHRNACSNSSSQVWPEPTICPSASMLKGAAQGAPSGVPRSRIFLLSGGPPSGASCQYRPNCHRNVADPMR